MNSIFKNCYSFLLSVCALSLFLRYFICRSIGFSLEWLNDEQLFDFFDVSVSPSFVLQGFSQRFTCSEALTQLTSHFQMFFVFFFFFNKSISFLLEFIREFMQHSLHELTAKQSFSSPVPLESYIFHEYSIFNKTINSQSDIFANNFFIEVNLKESFNKLIDGRIGKLKASQKILPLGYTRFLNW